MLPYRANRHIHAFLNKQHFYKQQPVLKLAKNQEKAKQHPEAELLQFESSSMLSISSSMLSSKTYMRYSKKCAKKQGCVLTL